MGTAWDLMLATVVGFALGWVCFWLNKRTRER